MAQPSLASGPRSCTHCRATFKAAFERCPNDGAPLVVVEHDPLERSMLGPYGIEDRIGEGAMGRIYRARHARLPGREVALKVLFGDVAAVAGMQQRFAHEAAATSRLAHPNIVSVIDFGETPEGLLYLAMELVDGRPLSDLIAEGPMPWQRAVAIARQLCVALAHAHAHEIVHRDLKPDNVLVADRDYVRIVDFGLALDVDPVVDRTRLTSGGMVVGTPAYSAPEQQLGNGVVDGRADLFSLGVTLFELLAGVVPFEGTAMEVICQNAMADRPTIASRARVAVPPALEALVEKLMRPEASQRYAATSEVIAALDALGRPPRPHSGWVVGATALPLIALGIAVMAWPRGDDVPRVAATPLVVETSIPVTHEDSGAESSDQRSTRARHDDLKMAAPTKHDDPKMGTPTKHDDPRMATPTKRADDPKMAAPTKHDDPKMATPTKHDDPKMAAPTKHDDPKMAAPTKRTAPSPMAPHVDTPASPSRGPVRIDLTNLGVRGALSTTTVKHALERASGDLHACYRTTAQRTPTSQTTTIAVRLVIDEAGRATDVDARGDSLLAVCVGAAFSNMRSAAAPEAGTVAVTFDVLFQP